MKEKSKFLQPVKESSHRQLQEHLVHRSEENRERSNAVHRFPLVLPIAGYRTRTQKENRVNVTAMPFPRRSFCHESMLNGGHLG